MIAALPSTRILYMGTSRFAVPALQALAGGGYPVVGVVTQPPRPAGRGRKVTPSPTLECADALGIPVFSPERVRSPEILDFLAGLRPDLIVVAAYAQILPASILDLPRYGCLNIHGSLLPRWRGASPIHAAILAGDTLAGVSIMGMEPSMDTGPVLGQSATRVEPEDTTPALEGRLALMGAALLLSVLPCYLAGSSVPVPQEHEKASYAPLIRKEDGLIDWKLPATRIWRQIRAYQPWPGSYSYHQGRRLRLLSARPLGAGPGRLEPGRVILSEAGRGGLAVATGDGALLLGTMAPEGGKPMTAREYLAGHRDIVGSLLTPEGPEALPDAAVP